MKFFLIGSGRCGSTLLCRMLNDSDDLFVFNETHWIPLLLREHGASRVAAESLIETAMRVRHAFGKPTFDFTQLADIDTLYGQQLSVVDFVDRISSLAARSEGKTFYADKTPDYCGHVRELSQHWPEAKFVHLIRNGLDTALSMARHPGYQVLHLRRALFWTEIARDSDNYRDQLKPVPVSACLEMWRKRTMRARTDGHTLGPNRYMELRFEDLVEQPQDSLSRLRDFVGTDLLGSDWPKRVAAQANSSVLDRKRDYSAIAICPRSKALMEDLGYDTP